MKMEVGKRTLDDRGVFVYSLTYSFIVLFVYSLIYLSSYSFALLLAYSLICLSYARQGMSGRDDEQTSVERISG